jgi:hypothetical protein
MTSAPAFARLIMPRGIELEPGADGGAWRFATTRTLLGSNELEQLGTPILAMDVHNPQSWVLIHARGSVVQRSLLTDSINARNLQHIRNLSYHLGAVSYHCTELALVYADLCRDLTNINTRLPDGRHATHTTFGGAEDAYYEFDACVTAARRIYSALREPLWTFLHSRHGNCPSDLETVLDLADRLPSDLREAITASWKYMGQRARAYRNSIEHYVPVDFGMSSASMAKLSTGVWSAQIRIPDNPEANSRRLFTYAQNLDALEFCRELASALSTLLRQVVDTIAATGG